MPELTLERFNTLKRSVEDAKSEASRAQGALDKLMDDLKRDHDCATVTEAETKLKKLEKDRDRLQKDVDKTIADYERKWKGEANE